MGVEYKHWRYRLAGSAKPYPFYAERGRSLKPDSTRQWKNCNARSCPSFAAKAKRITVRACARFGEKFDIELSGSRSFCSQRSFRFFHEIIAIALPKFWVRAQPSSTGRVVVLP